MQLELKLDSFEEFLTVLEALRGPQPVPTLLDHTVEEAFGQEALDEIQAIHDSISGVWTAVRTVEHDIKVQRGALEETITELRDLQKRAEGKAERPAQALARGVYCRFCGKMLNGTTQRIFCSQACAGRWQGQHKGHKATPRLTLKDERLGTTVVAGEGVRDN